MATQRSAARRTAACRTAARRTAARRAARRMALPASTTDGRRGRRGRTESMGVLNLGVRSWRLREGARSWTARWLRSRGTLTRKITPGQASNQGRKATHVNVDATRCDATFWQAVRRAVSGSPRQRGRPCVRDGGWRNGAIHDERRAVLESAVADGGLLVALEELQPSPLASFPNFITVGDEKQRDEGGPREAGSAAPRAPAPAL